MMAPPGSAGVAGVVVTPLPDWVPGGAPGNAGVAGAVVTPLT